MTSSQSRKSLVLKIEYHREMMNSLKEDSTSRAEFILDKEQHDKVQKLTGEADFREALRAMARIHEAKFNHYTALFKEQFPSYDADKIFEHNMDSMMDEIQSKSEPGADPELMPK
jgi:hypothetical protein